MELKRVKKLWGISLAVFLVLTVLVVILDREKLFLTINGGAVLIGGETFWGIVTNMGDGFFAALVPLFFAKKRPDMLRASLVATLVALPFIQGMKFFFQTARPGFVLPETANVIGHLPSSFSFPSGHTATVAVVFGVIFLMARTRLWRYVGLSIVILGGVSRIVVGVHWPLDVTIGWMIGISSAAVGAMLTIGREKRTLPMTGVLLLLTVGSGFFIFDYHLNPTFPVIRSLFGATALVMGVVATVSYFKGARHGRDEKKS